MRRATLANNTSGTTQAYLEKSGLKCSTFRTDKFSVVVVYILLVDFIGQEHELVPGTEVYDVLKFFERAVSDERFAKRPFTACINLRAWPLCLTPGPLDYPD